MYCSRWQSSIAHVAESIHNAALEGLRVIVWHVAVASYSGTYGGYQFCLVDRIHTIKRLRRR